jgi:RNA polymerase sigma-70 factor (ECF subfamily)
MPDRFDNLSDDQLAARAQAGRDEALAHFEELVRRNQIPLRHFLGKRFHSRRDNDDILQDSFLKAWQSLHLYNPRLSFRTWLYTITYRTAISHGRRDRPAQTLSPALASTIPPPHAKAAQLDDHLALWNIARKVLSDEQFTSLWLHYVDELSAGDIARILNRSWVSVKTILHRARKKLAPHLATRAIAPRRAKSVEALPIESPRLPQPTGEPCATTR